MPWLGTGEWASEARGVEGRWGWASLVGLGGGSTIVTLDPGEEEEFTVRWDQRDARGALVPAGGYFLELEDIDYQGQTIKLTFTSTVRFDIRPSAPS